MPQDMEKKPQERGERRERGPRRDRRPESEFQEKMVSINPRNQRLLRAAVTSALQLWLSSATARAASAAVLARPPKFRKPPARRPRMPRSTSFTSA